MIDMYNRGMRFPGLDTESRCVRFNDFGRRGSALMRSVAALADESPELVNPDSWAVRVGYSGMAVDLATLACTLCGYSPIAPTVTYYDGSELEYDDLSIDDIEDRADLDDGHVYDIDGGNYVTLELARELFDTCPCVVDRITRMAGDDPAINDAVMWLEWSEYHRAVFGDPIPIDEVIKYVTDRCGIDESSAREYVRVATVTYSPRPVLGRCMELVPRGHVLPIELLAVNLADRSTILG